jgi:hypothetical protein
MAHTSEHRQLDILLTIAMKLEFVPLHHTNTTKYIEKI